MQHPGMASAPEAPSPDETPSDRGISPSTAAVGATATEPAEIDDWVPQDRAPSAAENNFMSFSLFGFLILFAVGCLIIF